MADEPVFQKGDKIRARLKLGDGSDMNVEGEILATSTDGYQITTSLGFNIWLRPDQVAKL